jgi:hypothetical protein
MWSIIAFWRSFQWRKNHLWEEQGNWITSFYLFMFFFLTFQFCLQEVQLDLNEDNNVEMKALNFGTSGVVFNSIWSCIGFGVHDNFNNDFVFGVLNSIVYYSLPSSSCNNASNYIIKCRVGGGGVAPITQVSGGGDISIK